MAEGSNFRGDGTGPPGTGASGGTPTFGGFGGDTEHQDDRPNDGAQTTDKLHADTTPPKETNNGQGKPTGGPAEKTEPPAGGSSVPNRDRGISSDGSSPQQKPESKTNVSPVDKAFSASQQPATNAEKTSTVPGKSTDTNRNEAVKTHLPTAELTAVQPKSEQSNQPQAKSVEATKNSQSLHDENKDQTGTSAKALAPSDRTTSNAAQEKFQAGHSLEQKIATPGERQAAAPPQEHLSRPTQFDAQQMARAAQSDKPPQIAAAVPGVENKQFGQAPGRANNPGEPAPTAEKHEQANKTVDLSLQNSEHSKSEKSAAKLATEGEQHKKLDEPPKSPAAGELGSNNSAGREGKLVPEPNLSEATTKHGEPKSDVARGDQAVKEAPHKVETPQPSKEIRHDATENLTDKNIFIDKSKNAQIDGAKDTSIGNRPGETPTGNRDGKQDARSDKDIGNELTTKSDQRSDARVSDVVAGGSVGINLEGRGNRTEKSEPAERIILKVENLAVNLADKGTVANLLGVLEQIKTGKVIATDPESTAFAHAVLSMKETNLGKIEAALKTSDVTLLNAVLLDKLTPEQAEYQKLARWDLPKEKAKNEKLEAENQELKRDRNFLQGFIASVKNLFADFIHGRKLLGQDASAAEIVEEITIEAKNKNAVEQFMARTHTQLARYDAGEDAEQIDIEDAQVTASGQRSNQQKTTTRDTHVVETLSNCEAIALLKLGKAELGELLAQINQIESTLIDDRPKRRDLLPGEVLFLPTKQEIQAAVDLLERDAAT